MPKDRVITQQARKMVYDVNCFFKKESIEFVADLKLEKSRSAAANILIQKNLKSIAISLQQIGNRLSATDKLLINEVSKKLEESQKEVDKSYTTSNSKLQQFINNLNQCQKRTAAATKTSVATVRKIAAQGDNSESICMFQTPGKKRPRAKPITDIDSFEQGFIKQCIHNFHLTEKEFPTIEKLRKKLKNEINFQGSEASLRRIVRNLGFRWKKTENNRPLLIETSNICLLPIEYIKKEAEDDDSEVSDDSDAMPSTSASDTSNICLLPIDYIKKEEEDDDSEVSDDSDAMPATSASDSNLK